MSVPFSSQNKHIMTDITMDCNGIGGNDGQQAMDTSGDRNDMITNNNETISDAIDINDRPLCRLRRYLLFGCENNVVLSFRYSSLTAYLDFGHNGLKSVPKQRTLQCVDSLWRSVEKLDFEKQKSMSKEIHDVINDCLPHLRPNCFPRLLWSLFKCQNPDAEQRSPLRSLAYTLFRKPYIHSTDVLLFASLVGRQTINSSHQLRHLFKQYYDNEVDDKLIEESLVFGNQFGWTHKDIIKLCHFKTNSVTMPLFRYKNMPENVEPTPVEKRLAVLRSTKSKLHEIVSTLDDTLLEPNCWFRALNTIWRKDSIIWRKLIESLADDRLLQTIPHIIIKFPNSHRLFEDIILRLQRKETKLTSNFLKNIVFYLCQHKYNECQNYGLTQKTRLLHQMTTTLQRLTIPKQIDDEIVVIFDKNIDFNRPFLFGLEKKNRIRPDLLDQMMIKDFIYILLNSFNCFVPINGQLQNILFVNTTASSGQYDTLEYPFIDMNVNWKRRVIFVTNIQQDYNEWTDNLDNKLIIIHINSIEFVKIGSYQPNVLVLNGFDVKWESYISNFFNLHIK
ncbi:uncharacterized protein LOC128957305 [Oppia nitens]|uniref:uncharacterized protein LOC128957305 n=1 Tax=Oppia nitens TaxID=1686743 RepID=UPI0023DAF083|nr:uncharacterized protein LOC128957305 [Oppia nitens]